MCISLEVISGCSSLPGKTGRTVNAAPDGGWLAGSGGFEGRQYEVIIKEVSIQSTKFRAIVLAETVLDNTKGITNENPALKWSLRTKIPQIVPILHSVELSCVLAPAMYIGGMLACGPAVELNLVSDCSIEISVDQVVLFKNLHQEFDGRPVRSYPQVGGQGEHLPVREHNSCMLKLRLRLDDPVSKNPNYNSIKPSTETCHTTYDSGVETTASSSKTKMTEEEHVKKSVSVAFVETEDAANFLEVFVTMGVVDLSLYVADDGSPEVIDLKPPSVEKVVPETPTPQQEVEKEDDEKNVVSPVQSRNTYITSRLSPKGVGRDNGTPIATIANIQCDRGGTSNPGRGFDPFDPRLLSIKLDVELSLNGLEVSPLSHCVYTLLLPYMIIKILFILAFV
ncbi:hypothetical protein SFRURICE_015386 [Spodoptera frugiperda]|nr:hypothetical protein SFRURICE_015386 [Spodoptera frugiperda]